MSTIYTPDRWLLIQIEGEPTPRIFASWVGSYLYGSSWKLSSGNSEFKDQGEFYIVPQVSGSIYSCYKVSEGVTAYAAGVLETLGTQRKIEVLNTKEYLCKTSN